MSHRLGYSRLCTLGALVWFGLHERGLQQSQNAWHQPTHQTLASRTQAPYTVPAPVTSIHSDTTGSVNPDTSPRLESHAMKLKLR